MRKWSGWRRFVRDLARSNAPVVALLDFPRRDRCEVARRAGAAAVLGKPWLNADLIATIRKHAIEQSSRRHIRSPTSCSRLITILRSRCAESLASNRLRGSARRRPVRGRSSAGRAWPTHGSPDSCAARQTSSSSGNSRGGRPPTLRAAPADFAEIAERDDDRRRHLEHPAGDQLVAGGRVAALEGERGPNRAAGRRRRTNRAATAGSWRGDWRPARGRFREPRRQRRRAPRRRDGRRSRQSRGRRPTAAARAARRDRRRWSPAPPRRRADRRARRAGRGGERMFWATTRPIRSATTVASTGGSVTPASQSTSAAQASSAAANSSAGISESMGVPRNTRETRDVYLCTLSIAGRNCKASLVKLVLANLAGGSS